MAAIAVPGYSDLHELGRGGSATVYRARQDAVGREVALKVLHAGLEEKSQQRFTLERQVLGQLSWHPNMVVVFDAGLTASGVAYLAMEYLPSGSLADHLALHGPLAPDAAVRATIEIAGALHTAHCSGVLHRDVKPGNILVGVLGQAKLADFGIANLVDAANTTMTGTYAHLAPEVLDGGRASVASDVYSLGSTLFELLAGKAAFVGDHPEAFAPMFMRIMEAPVPDLRRVGVPDGVADVVEAMMAKDPGDRPASPEAAARALQEVQRRMGADVTPLVLPPSPPGGERRDPPARPSGQETLPAGGPDT